MAMPHQDPIFGHTGPVAKAAALVVLMLAVTVFLFSMPEEAEVWHRSRSLAQKLFFFPLLLAAAWFGVRGAAAATTAVTGISGAMIALSQSPDFSLQVERMGEVGVFWLVGALAANFFEQQKKYVDDLEIAHEDTLVALASALDVREHNTGLHSNRVADYTRRLASEMGIGDQATLSTVWKGALLHDVGKIGIPDSILLKPGPLSEDEWQVMRRHPGVGYGLLKKIEFLREPGEIVLNHHEKFDGTGYPAKKKGNDIPLSARMFAVIDVYDAITTDRSYHNAESHAAALEILRKKSGNHFDPEVIEAFKRVPFEDWREIAKRNETALREREVRA